MGRYAVLDKDGVVVNVVVWDGVTPWNPPDGHTVQEDVDVVADMKDVWAEKHSKFMKPDEAVKEGIIDASVLNTKEVI